MNKITLIIICIITTLLGTIFFFYQQSWILISFPTTNQQLISSSSESIKPQQITLWVWKQNKWLSETSEIIGSNNTAQTIQLLLNNWFLLLEEEQITDKQTTIQSVSLSANNTEAFISFNQNPLDPQASTYETCMLIEGLLKTLRTNHIPLQSVRLLVHHHPLQDDRLNFEISWPIDGYIANL